MKMVYIRAEIIGENAMGQKRVHLLANNADGIVIWTNDKGFLDPDRGEIQEVRHAYWVKAELDPDFVSCSECKAEAKSNVMAFRKDYAKEFFRFCPECGAKMSWEVVVK